MKNRNGVVVSLAVLFEDADGATRFMSCAKEDILEQALLNMIGTGTGEKETAGGHLFHHVPVEIFISAEGFIDIVALFHKGRRVENDEIVIEGSCFEKIKHVFTDEAMVGKAVEGEVLVQARLALGAHLDTVDMGSAARKSRYGKTACVGKAIEDASLRR